MQTGKIVEIKTKKQRLQVLEPKALMQAVRGAKAHSSHSLELRKERVLHESASKLIQVYDLVAPRTEKLYEFCHRVLVHASSRASKSESVIPLLSQGVKQLMEAGSEIAKTRVEPFMNEIRESQKDYPTVN